MSSACLHAGWRRMPVRRTGHLALRGGVVLMAVGALQHRRPVFVLRAPRAAREPPQNRSSAARRPADSSPGALSLACWRPDRTGWVRSSAGSAPCQPGRKKAAINHRLTTAPFCASGVHADTCRKARCCRTWPGRYPCWSAWGRAQQCARGHELAGLAVVALRHIDLVPKPAPPTCRPA